MEYHIVAHINSPQQQSIVIFGTELHGTSPNTCASLRSSWSSASAICQMSSTVSSASSPQQFWDPCIFCRRTNSLEFTAWSSARSSCWLQTVHAGREDVSVRRTFEAL